MWPDLPEYSLLPYLRQFQSAMGPVGSSLLKDEKLCQLVQALDSDLGKDQLLYEFSPHGQGYQVDLACWLPAAKSSRDLFASCSKLDMPQAWKDAVQAVADTESRALWPGWTGVWFEFDSHGLKPTRPNIFFSFAKQEHTNHLQIQNLVSLIEHHAGISPAILEKLATLRGQIAAANILQIGFLLPRGAGDRIKVCLANVSSRKIETLQNTLQFSLSSEFMAIWEKTTQKTPNWVLALDVFPDQPTRAAFEIQPAASPICNKYAWKRILESISHLERAPVNADIAHGHIQSCVSSNQWPPKLKHEWQQRGEIVDSLLLTSLNHVKLFEAGHENPMFKYYYLQQPFMKTRQRTYERPRHGL